MTKFSEVVLASILVVLLPCLCAAARQLLEPDTSISGQAIVVARDTHNKPADRLLAVHTPSGARIQVQLDDWSQTAGIHTGMAVDVRGRWAEAGAPLAGGDAVRAASSSSSSGVAARVFKASSLQAVGPAKSAAAPRILHAGLADSGGSDAAPGGATDTVLAAAVRRGGSAKAASVAAAVGTTSTNLLVASELPTLFVPIAAVGKDGAACPGTELPYLSTAELRQVLFQEDNPTRHTVGSTFNQCSYNKTRLTAANSRLANTVRLPCSGRGWTFRSCSFSDYSGWADAADAVLKKRGVDLSKYKFKVYLVPPSAGCGEMVGMGYVGCDGNTECRSWIGGSFWDTPQAIAHEVGHALWMAHATGTAKDSTVNEYGDEEGVMGACCRDRCWNTPHAWQAGWLTVQQLDGSSLQPGQTATISLASQGGSDHSGLRVVPSWAAGVDPLFLGYRTQAGGDSELVAELAGRVHIHTSAIAHTFDSAWTNWMGSLKAAGSSWSYPAAGLVVRAKAFSQTAATVTVCRIAGAETPTSCAAGNDNDCNGLVGAADPACVNMKLKKRW